MKYYFNKVNPARLEKLTVVRVANMLQFSWRK